MSMRRPVHFGDAINAAFNATNEDIGVGGGYPDDSASYGWPVPIGGKAVNTDGSDPGSVAEGDTAGIKSDRNRRLLVNTAHPNLWRYTINWATAQGTTELKSAPGAATALYITDFVFSATAQGTFSIQEWATAATPTNVVKNVYCGTSRPVPLHFVTPLRLTANKALGITSSGVTKHSVYVAGYSAP